ncbi:magnesium chelatase [Portibacter lacus]|uniref:Magnesium chelatase n=1 Tax=Portibacter lacus TaxID=1099794 RepID=A0AA37WEG9_9BACT|nr:magnesium chelatase [Portibacter lacus]GLR17382.1 magnesium chelatase [Portibacter lacus]
MTELIKIKTLGALKKSGYVSKSLKEELRDNLITALQNKQEIFTGIKGFEDTVIPDLERAILSKHNVLLLGLRGQAKTKIARLLVRLMDEYIPVIKGNELNDDPLNPITKQGKLTIQEHGDKTEVEWMHRDDRYVEKLATPDVSISDLIGDVDPIKAATLKLPYSDERVIHFGLVPRSHRCIFVINELPDLQPRIQVSLFNILQEGDLQIRGFKLRLPLDIQFVFTANPEDYTNRGSIITPLKDRIESQILTHYPREIETAMEITAQEAGITEIQAQKISFPDELKRLLEMVSFNARESELIDEKSGVSARLSISAYENLVSTAERRMLISGDDETQVRVTDLWGIIPAITGKVELVYEGEQEGPYNVAIKLIGQAIKEMFLSIFPNPDKRSKREEKDPYGVIKEWFGAGNHLELLNDASNAEFESSLDGVAGLKKMIQSLNLDKEKETFYKELAIHGLSELDIISKDFLDKSTEFSDPLSEMFDDFDDDSF